jgi:hypothetical protein
LSGEHVLELLERRDQLTGLRAERLDERPSSRDREIEAVVLRLRDEPGLQLLLGDIDLANLADRLDELLETHGDLPPLGDDAGKDQGGVRVGCLEIPGDLLEGLLAERPGVVDEERARLAEQRRRGQPLELSALPLGRIDLGRLGRTEERESRLSKQVRVFAPEERHGRAAVGHLSDSIVGVGPSKMIVIVPARSVLQTSAPLATRASSVAGTGWP